MTRTTWKIYQIIGRHPQVVVGFFILVVFALFLLGSRYYVDQTRKALAYETAKAFEVSITTLHNFYSKDIVPRAEAAGIKLSDDYTAHNDQIPFPATMTITFGEKLQEENTGMVTALYSYYPFKRRAHRILDDFQEKSLEFLAQNPEMVFSRFETLEGREVIRYSKSMLMKKDCVTCHNNSGFNRIWEVGDFRGAREVVIDLPQITALEQEMNSVGVGLAVFVTILGAFLMLPTVGLLQSSARENKRLAVELAEQNTSLESADRAKSRLLKGVGHDLRSPLNAIIGFSEVMQNELLGKLGNEKYIDYSKSIHDSGQHLLRMINQLLSTDNLEGSGWRYEEEIIDISLLISSIEPVLRSSVEKAGIGINVVSLAQDCQLRGDGRALRQMLTNLVDNAVKYSEASKIVVTFKLTKGQLVLAVEDNGIGISGEEIRRLRNENYRGKSSEDKGVQGLGIGLWLVDSFARMHNAELEIVSEEGQGCTFSIIIPAERLISQGATSSH
ncbi:ATP-binding protein [Kiloniella laminariae]|uniref:histidine kinase n=1 Tax=Kiloniella laminariae TaxID=454162 RepID=A0ABT4LQ80_9PROT|nr:ATP-binding protein [Kiloniella laminariae]MCZ4282481.1 ATP-binding protein [Kiloniella laminariae]